MRKRFIPLTALLIISFAAAGLGYRFLRDFSVSSELDRPGSSSDKGSEIGEVQAIQGDVSFRRPQTVDLRPLATPHSLHLQELIVTGRDSEARIAFQGGAVVRLLENSRLVATRRNGDTRPVDVTLLSGSVSLVRAGQPHSIQFFQEGEKLSLSPESDSGPSVSAAAATSQNKQKEINPTVVVGLPEDIIKDDRPTVRSAPSDSMVIVASEPKETTKDEHLPLDPAENSPTRSLPPKKSRIEGSVSDQEIIGQLRLQTAFFQRCYLNYLNRSRKAREAAKPGGVITVAFTIQSRGRVSDVTVVRSDFQDTILHRCISETVGRTNFKAFNGDDVLVAEFPISLKH